LAQYTGRHKPDKTDFKEAPEARRFDMPYRSLQGRPRELDEAMWHLAKGLPEYAPVMRSAKKDISSSESQTILKRQKRRLGDFDDERLFMRSFNISSSVNGCEEKPHVPASKPVR
jgi:hypothetical protein